MRPLNQKLEHHFLGAGLTFSLQNLTHGMIVPNKAAKKVKAMNRTPIKRYDYNF
jgi:hypothetical protein